MAISNEPQVPVSEPIPFQLGTLRDTHTFLLIYQAKTSQKNTMPKFLSSPKGRNFFLEFGNSRQNNPPDELNDTDIFCLSLMVLELILETLTICSCGIRQHFLLGQNLQFMLANFTAHLPPKFKQTPHNLSPELINIL